MKKNVEIFNKSLREQVSFEKLGFQEVEYDAFSFSWKLIRQTNDKIDKLIYSFSKDKWSDDLILHPISAYIIFEKVNAILWTISKDERYLPQWHDNTIIRLPNFDLEVDKYIHLIRDLLFVNNRVVNKQIFEKALGIFKEQLDTIVLPFFDKIQTLQDINDKILERVDWMEWHKYISGLNGVHYFKSIIIMKLCNNENGYSEFTKMYSQLLLDAINSGRSEVQVLYNTWQDLLEYLDSGKYLEIDKSNTTTELQSSKTLIVPKREALVLSTNKDVTRAFQLFEPQFNALGIYFDQKLTLNDYRNDANWQSWGMDKPDSINFRYFLLLFAGVEVFEEATQAYQPVSTNVYYFNTEWDGYVSYAEIINRLNLLTGNSLPLSDVRNVEEGLCGFTYKDTEYKWQFELQGDWTDPEIFESFIGLVKPDLNKEFYIMEEGQGGIIVYYSPEEKSAFEQYFNKNLEPLYLNI